MRARPSPEDGPTPAERVLDHLSAEHGHQALLLIFLGAAPAKLPA